MKFFSTVFAFLVLVAALQALLGSEPLMPNQHGFLNPLPALCRDYVPSSIYRYQWREYWAASNRDEYSYHPQNPRIEIISSIMQNESWIFSNKNSDYQNPQGLTYMTRSYLWQNDDWQTHSCVLMDYNSAGQITQSKLYDWWNDENDHSELRSHYIYSYQNSLLSEMQINMYNDSQLYFVMNYHYCYDASDNLLQIDFEMTQVSSGQTIYQRSLYTYDNQNRLSEIAGEKLENEVWIRNSKSLYSYDSLNRVIEILYQLVLQGNPNLQNFSKTLFSYNEQGLRAEEIGMSWTQNFTWNNSTRTLYSYQYVPNEDLIQSPQPLSLYPNPFSDQIRLQFNLKKPQNARLKIYDIKGRLIYDKNYGNFHSGNHEITFEARSSLQESLPSGIYFLSLQIGKQRINKKAIKIK